MSQCCCGKYTISQPLTLNGYRHEPLGPEGNFCGDSIQHEIRDLTRQNKEMLAMLEELQYPFNNKFGGECCLSCFRLKKDGHTTNCRLDNLLAKVREQ